MRLQSRIERLEREAPHEPETVRVLWHIVTPEAPDAPTERILAKGDDREVVTFDRATGEDDDSFYRRIYATMGWPEGYGPRTRRE